ncbi:unnamed protein product, partial [Ectocarpus sp. 13 AM-2016]
SARCSGFWACRTATGRTGSFVSTSTSSSGPRAKHASIPKYLAARKHTQSMHARRVALLREVIRPTAPASKLLLEAVTIVALQEMELHLSSGGADWSGGRAGTFEGEAGYRYFPEPDIPPLALHVVATEMAFRALRVSRRKEGAVPAGAPAVGRGRCRSVGRVARGILLRGGGRVGPRGLLRVAHRGHRRFPQQVQKCFLRVSQDGCSCSGVPPQFLRS